MTREFTWSVNDKIDYDKYFKGDFEYTSSLYPTITHVCSKTPSKPTIKKVVFNNPAAIILWKDGTKTVVKCQNGEPFDEEKGFVMAYLKKLLGNDNTFNKEIKKYCIADYLPDYLKEDDKND